MARDLAHALLPFPPDWVAYTVRFGIRDGTAPGAHTVLLGGARRYVASLLRRVPGALVLLALDRQPKTLRWHVHGVAVVPSTVDPATLIRWWCRLWPRERAALDAPARRAAARAGQYADPLPPEDFQRVLRHHLDGHLRGAPGLPPLATRVVTSAALAGPWRDALGGEAPKGAPASSGVSSPPRRTRKTSPDPSRRCRWCGRSLAGVRRGARWHPTCRASALRALARERSRHDPEFWRAHVAPWLRALPRAGYYGRDAIRAALYLASECPYPGPGPRGRTLPPGVHDDGRGWRAHVDAALRCSCGRALAKRLDATTCAASACRMRAARARRTSPVSPRQGAARDRQGAPRDRRARARS